MNDPRQRFAALLNQLTEWKRSERSPVVLLFDSAAAASDLAFMLDGQWDGCNGVVLPFPDKVAVNTAANLAGASWCQEGESTTLLVRLTEDEFLRRYAAGERSFVNANLRCALLAERSLCGVNLSHAKLGWANLNGANLSGADLTAADLSDANLSGAALSQTNLVRTDLTRTNLDRADLRGANLSKASLCDASLREADLQGANLSFADLRGATLSEAAFRGANLTGTKLTQGQLSA